MKDIYRQGHASEEVADIQARLRALGHNIADPPGEFGPSTAAAVRAFQQQRSMLVDGIVGSQTWSHLVEASWHLGDRTLYLKRPYMRGDDVSILQRRLNALGYDAGREDGIFGPLAYRAVKEFQREYGISEDGMYGPRTHVALEGLRVDRPGTAAEIREELRHRHRHNIADVLVMIDPGHGAENAGGIGPSGLLESDVNWHIATLLAERLASAGARVRLTRIEPEDPDASERAKRANDADADVFVSLHLNSHTEPTAEGSSVYHFGTSRAGRSLAESIQDELVSQGRRDCRVHARSYAVLRETRMPAVFVEPAFITNPDEEKRLGDPDHRSQIADAIARGLGEYFSNR